ncbi:ribbon-helix-helix domain-containing protein [Alteromonas oceanisediminis]|uniref:ribbon-helix-helix domain-containing protein n=1 Tax=Alteromonas oceanisediminis TaxID=2836180 RepID=UPI001BDA7EE1|nr:type II toxin-antitoxin system ParD family antitoxin [Alteromonas oceanisediminis]MBT0587365.1 type II toxin-antitoxin system ParD family antitoxin [Alteromonas oceanisediminis]
MSMVKKSITVTNQQNEWLQAQLNTGKYASDSELLRDLIRKEQTRSEEINVIREALLMAENSGISDRSPKEILNDVLQKRALNAKL